jgi:hypothetical protein
LKVSFINTSGRGTIALFAAAISGADTGGDISVQRYAELVTIVGRPNISAGAIDWVHCADESATSITRKDGIAPLLSAPVFSVNPGWSNDFNAANGGLAFSGGTPFESSTGSMRIAFITGNVLIAAPSTPAWRVLTIYTGCWQSTSTIEVFDDSGAELTVFKFDAGATALSRQINVLFRSDEPTNVYVRISSTNNGNISLAGYSLHEVGTSPINASVSMEPAPYQETLNLSDRKFIDWTHFGLVNSGDINRKIGGFNMVGAISSTYSVGLNRGGDFMTYFSWNDGTPTQSASNTRGFTWSWNGMEFKINVLPGIWKFSVYTSVWRSTGYVEFIDENGAVVGVAHYDSQIAADGQSQYRKINLLYSSDEAHTITVRSSPSCAFDGYTGNMSFAAVTIEKYLDHVSIANGGEPDVRTEMTAKAFISPDDSIEFYTYEDIEFRWQSADSINGPFADIPGATSASYKPVIGDAGKYIRVALTYNSNTYYAVTDSPVSDLMFAPVFYDGKGESVSSLLASPMSARLKYHNKTAGELKLAMFVAIYAENGTLQYIASEEINFEPDGLDEFDVPLLYTVKAGDYAKVFVWDANFIPEREAVTFR